jgi:hypothetical protein
MFVKVEEHVSKATFVLSWAVRGIVMQLFSRSETVSQLRKVQLKQISVIS